MNKAMFALPLLFAVVALGMSSIFVVDEREKALVLQFGEVKQVKEDPGLGFKLPLIQNVARFDDRILGLPTREPLEVTPLDDRRLVVDAFARWRIRDVVRFREAAGADGVLTHTTVNPNAPSALMYAWMGPFIGALIRPIGGWISDKVGGALVTQIITVVMIAAALGVAYYMSAAYQSATPEQYFMPFFLLFLTLFAASGIGNGSTFRTIAMVCPKEQAGPVLGWTSAVAAYGAFIIPQVFGEQINATTPEYALYGFAVFYFICLVLNGWYYLGPKAEFKNP